MLLIMCHASTDRYALEVRHVSAVLACANLQHPSGLPSWLAGVLVYRGTSLPVMDLTQLTQGHPCPNRLSSRILVLSTQWDGVDRSFGLLAENVGLSEIVAGDEEAAGRAGGPTALGTLQLDAQGVFQQIDLDLLLGEDRRETLFAAEERR